MAKRNKKRGRKPQYSRKQRKAVRMEENKRAAVSVNPLGAKMLDEITLACIRADLPRNLKAAFQQAQSFAQLVQKRGNSNA